ncbi:SDR family oxidoreductase [Flagellimonas sp. HMM57]|uniref:SDR family oxidoreductase n=1 Tax=unclassified Flagellimonas TaxID=2644544 RepID=UPI0013D8D5AD|nr:MULTISPECIES: SDR family oxidoreductase [unclassified Flagellimonas]UII77339.1 SDR family oxidoreductase [Flagellimonas sp. HMM57]
MIEKIGILGCGWLGLPLAKHFVSKKYEVHGTTTSEQKLRELKQEGIVPYHISLSVTKIEGDIQNFLSHIDVLILNVPPKLRGANKESYIEKIRLLYSAVKKSAVVKLIFVSSTSVYGDVEGEVTEETRPEPVTESGKQLLQCEQLFINDGALESTIIRFGGLIGPTRHPVTMLSRRQNLKNGNDPVNLIHLKDCIHLIDTIIENNYWSEVFNGVYPLHPSKKEYYTNEAIKRGLNIPEYSDEFTSKPGKIIRSNNYLHKNHIFYTSIIS